MPPKPILSALVGLAFFAILAGAKACDVHGSVGATETLLRDYEGQLEVARDRLARHPNSEGAKREVASVEERLAGVRPAYAERRTSFFVWSGVCGLFVALIGGAVVMLVRVRDRWRS
jgi:hypothetical protein